tara:strand:- start:121 stop:252 length:132 start_codon:yes stop_codon:yes gene_type:complete
MKIKFEAEIDTREDDEIGLLLVELLQAVKERIDLMNEDDYDEN